MKIRSLVSLCALLIALAVSGVSAAAEEDGTQTVLSSTTISGSVRISVHWHPPSTSQDDYPTWWRRLIAWLGGRQR